MNIALIIAAGGPSLAVPGPFWLFTILHWLTFALHLVAMNMLLGGLIILLIAKTSPFRKMLFDTQIKLFPTVMAATITLGVAPLLFVQVIYGKYFYSASIISGWQWFLIIPVLLGVYYFLYAAALHEKPATGRKAALLRLSLLGLAYISFTFTSISDLAEKPFLWKNIIAGAAGATTVNPDWLETIFRWGHMLAGAMVVAAVSILIFTLFFKPVHNNRDLRLFGTRMFYLGVIKAAVLAVIYLLTLDGDIFAAFLNSPGLHATLGAIVLNILAVILIYRADHKPESAKGYIMTGSLMVFLGLFCMVVGRHYLRLVYLDGYFDPGQIATSSQFSPFFMFLIVFALGLVVLFWMLRKYFTSPATP